MVQTVNELSFEELYKLTTKIANIAENQSILLLNNNNKNKNNNSDKNTIVKEIKIVRSPQSSQCMAKSSKDAYLDTEKNWLFPTDNYTKACRACQYYGHVQKNCPNIPSSYRDCCNNCWTLGHEYNNCRFIRKQTPYVEGYIRPEDLVKGSLLLNEGN